MIDNTYFVFDEVYITGGDIYTLIYKPEQVSSIVRAFICTLRSFSFRVYITIICAMRVVQLIVGVFAYISKTCIKIIVLCV